MTISGKELIVESLWVGGSVRVRVVLWRPGNETQQSATMQNTQAARHLNVDLKFECQHHEWSFKASNYSVKSYNKHGSSPVVILKVVLSYWKNYRNVLLCYWHLTKRLVSLEKRKKEEGKQKKNNLYLLIVLFLVHLREEKPEKLDFLTFSVSHFTAPCNFPKVKHHMVVQQWIQTTTTFSVAVSFVTS